MKNTRNWLYKGRRLSRIRRRRQQEDQEDPLKMKPSTIDRIVENAFGWVSDYNKEREKWKYWDKGNYVDFLVGGANAFGRGIEGLSGLPFGPAITGDIRAYRHNQGDELKRDLRAYLDKMKPGDKIPRVWGHSWGGSTVANIASEFPNVQFNALDPVSRFHRLDKYPDNLRVFQPEGNGEMDNTTIFNSLARTVGGAWPVLPPEKGKTIRYKGDHINGIDSAICEAIRADLAKDRKESGDSSQIELQLPSLIPGYLDPLVEKKDRDNRKSRADSWRRMAGLPLIPSEQPDQGS